MDTVRSRLLAAAGAMLLVLLLAGVARANNGDPWILGTSNSAANTTFLSYTGSSGDAFFVGTGASGTFDSAVRGNSSSAGIGVFGQNNGGGTGVFGQSIAGGVGVEGFSSGSPGDPDSFGVRGSTTSANGIGVQAFADSGGTALSVDGVSRFSMSGIAVVPLGATQVTVTGVGLTDNSLILALPQQATNRIVVFVAPDVANAKFTIRLNKAVGSDTSIGWFVVN